MVDSSPNSAKSVRIGAKKAPPRTTFFLIPSNGRLRWWSAVERARVVGGWARCACWLHGNLASAYRPLAM